MKKVLTMTLNPCIDRTVYMESFQVGGTNIVKKVIEEAAGKGINVAIGLQHLQVPVKAVGFAYKEDLNKLYGKLEAERIPYAFVEVNGRLRVNQKLFDESKSEMTECNEKGMPVRSEEVDRLLELLRDELVGASILVLSGSVPPGVDKDIYAVMTSMANEAGVKVILDAAGELLSEGVKAKPYLIKPNRDEFVKAFVETLSVDKKESTNCRELAKEQAPAKEQALIETDIAEELLTESDIEQIAKELFKQGLSYICLSLGADGAMLISNTQKECGLITENHPESIYHVKIDKRPAISVPIRSLQGAGDAMVAGLCKAIYEENEGRMLDYALNMAASTIMLEGTQMGKIKFKF